ncbi:MAG: hypothetical protein HYX60_08915 [Legionella longbeachae]|nr:hypothetical protein [Legionella longbeachae]
MTAPTLFHSPMNGFIHQESVRKYEQQLAKKKNHLMNAQESYHKASDLIDQFKQDVSTAKEELRLLEKALTHSKDSKKIEKLELQKKQYELFIESAPKKLEPIIQRLDRLAENIQKLEDDIKEIENLRTEQPHP